MREAPKALNDPMMPASIVQSVLDKRPIRRRALYGQIFIELYRVRLIRELFRVLER